MGGPEKLLVPNVQVEAVEPHFTRTEPIGARVVRSGPYQGPWTTPPTVGLSTICPWMTFIAPAASRQMVKMQALLGATPRNAAPVTASVVGVASFVVAAFEYEMPLIEVC